jgi:hypothetical protein
MIKNKFDYISILAGGSCRFDCHFCVGNDIREYTSPHFSSKFKAFIECFADQTNLLSVSGDTSDPSFIRDSWLIPSIAKQFNESIRVTFHTRSIDSMQKAFDSGYDKFVFSIDETLTQDILNTLLPFKDKVRLSLVITRQNLELLPSIFLLDHIYDFQITFRPDVFEQNRTFNLSFLHFFITLSSDTDTIPYRNDNGSITHPSFPGFLYWNYLHTNKQLNVRYLFSNGDIASNCKWSEITKS